MRRFPHNIDKDILAVYQRPSWLPPSDDEFAGESEESEVGEEVEEEAGEEGGEEEEVEEEEEEEECVEEEEEILCFEGKDKICCLSRKKEDEGTVKKLEVSGKLETKAGEKSHVREKRSKSKEDQTSSTMESITASQENQERDKLECIDIIQGMYMKNKSGLRTSDEESEEELGFMAALREKRLIEDDSDTDDEDEGEEEEYLWEVDEKVAAAEGLILKPREYDPYDEDSDEIIDAGDEGWIDGLIPTLADLAIKTIARNLELYEDTDLQSLMTREDWNFLIEDEISLDIPLNLSVPMIPESYYWEKACKYKFKKVTCYEHGNSWKRMFLELTCQHFIENLTPSTAVRREINNLTELLEPHVLKLAIDQMAVEQIQQEDGTTKWSRVDLGGIIPQLTNLQEIHVTYGAKDCGLDFGWYKFEVSEEDIRLLGESITDLIELRIFKLHRCKVTDPICVSLWNKLSLLKSLRELHFVHSCLSDESASALASLIINMPQVTHLDLKNNQIGFRGAQSLAEALGSFCGLDYLNLSLNAIEDEGAQSIATALKGNKHLTQLHLGGCSFGPATFVEFATCLKINSTLLVLNLSNNEVSEDAFVNLMASLEENEVIQDLDVRMTGVDDEWLRILRKRLDINKGMIPHDKRIINPRFKDEICRHFSLDGDISDPIAMMSRLTDCSSTK